MKKISAIILALILAMAMMIPAFADDAATTGTININNAKASTTYNAYQVLDLESYDTTTGAYAYKAASDAWSTFLNQSTIKGVYVNVDDQGYVTWVTDADTAAFAKLAIAYADATDAISATGTTTTAADATTASITGLDLGYYLVDSTVGTLCELTTTATEATINEKNDVPTIVKKIVEDGAEVESNTASIGDTVSYKLTVTAKKGAEAYVIHDTLSSGLTLDASTITVSSGEGTYSLNTAAFADDCTFEIAFTQDYLDTITADTTITVTYNATLNSSAVIAGEGNPNTVDLTYGNTYTTAESKVTTYTYSVDVVKTDASNKILSGAEFELYDAAGNQVKVTLTDGVYKVDAAGTDTITAGNVTIAGLGAGTYSLKETKAPKGYNKLGENQEFTISDSNLTAVATATDYTSGGVQVINQTGSILPTTGGIGTAIFYIVGTLLVLGAAVYFVSKKRLAAKAERA